jgi:acyl carrier protein
MDKPNDQILDKVRRVVTRTFPTATTNITAETALETLAGWDSLGHINLMMEMEREFAVRFSTENLSESKTVGGICELLHQMQPNS